MKIKKIDTLMIAITVVLCGADLLIKQMILNTFNSAPYPYSASISVIGDFFKLTYVQNFGITFGLLSDLPVFITTIILIVISIMAFGVLVYFYKNLHKLLRNKVVFTGYICLSVIMGGALGNIIDRIQNGFVIDYLDLGIQGYRWYTFNLADICIVCGCILLTILMTFFEDKSMTSKDLDKNS
ncbi:MAG: signal peptidase II [Brevinema sp.]